MVGEERLFSLYRWMGWCTPQSKLWEAPALPKQMNFLKTFKGRVGSSDKLFRNHDFFSEKIILGPQEGEIPPPLAQMVLTQCISISELLVYHRAPPGGQI